MSPSTRLEILADAALPEALRPDPPSARSPSLGSNLPFQGQAMSLLSSLADSLRGAQVSRPTASEPVSPGNDGTPAPSPPADATTRSAERPTAGAVLGIGPRTVADEDEDGPREPIDAEALAALVNEALVEQARWHGVDLS